MLREICIQDEENASDLIIGIATVCFAKYQKDLGNSSLFFWKFLAKESQSSNELVSAIYSNKPETVIEVLV